MRVPFDSAESAATRAGVMAGSRDPGCVERKNRQKDAWQKSPARVAYLKAEQEQADRESAMMQDTDM